MSDQDNETAAWPSSPSALVDTQSCPSCFHPLTAMTCGHCGLVVADPRALRLLELGRSMIQLEAQRQQIIGEIRLTHAPPPVPAPVAGNDVAPAPGKHWSDYAPPAAASAPPLPAEPVLFATAEDAAGASVAGADADGDAMPWELQEAPDPTARSGESRGVADAADAVLPPIVEPDAAPARPPRRRLTVPVLLLIVGVSLVGIAAVFFLILAWTVADIGMKSLIIGGVTLATMVAASLLRRWSLTATAEGIGALGVILLALDGWAARANDLFGTQGMDAVLYAGIVALAIGILCRVWAVLSRLRVPDLAATLALPVGLGLLAAGLLPLETSAVITVGLLGVALGGLAHALPAPWSAARSREDSVPERTALMAIGLAGLAGAAAATLFLGLESMAVQLAAAAAVILLAVAYAVVLRPREGVEGLPASVPIGRAAAGLAAGFAASLGWQMAIQDDVPVYTQLVGPVVAALVAVALDRRQPGGGSLLVPRIAAALVAGPGVVLLAATSVTRGAETIAGTWVLWETPVFTPPPGADLDAALFALIASAVIAVLIFLAPTLGRPGIREVRPIASAVILLAGALGTGIPIAVVSAAILVAALALLALTRGARPVGWGTAAGIAVVTAFLGGMAAPWLWTVGVVVAAAVPLLARAATRARGVAAIALVLAPVLVCGVAAMIAPLAIGAAFGVEPDSRAGLALVQWVALIAISAAAWARLDVPSRAALAFASYALFVMSLITYTLVPAGEASVSSIIGEPLLGIVRAAGLLIVFAVVGLLWTRIGAVASLGAAALVAPAAAGLGIAVLATAGVPDDGWPAFTTMAAAVAVVCIGALLPSRVFAAFGAGPDEAPGADTQDDPGGREEDAAAAVTATSPAGDVTAAAAGDAPPRASLPTLVRRASDLGALATATMALGWQIPDDMRWPFFSLIALGFAAAAVTRGWAAPVAAAPEERMEGHSATAWATAHRVPSTRARGLRLSDAPRRLFAWPAFASATLALWSWLGQTGSSLEIEAFVLPPAVGMIVFAAVLVWLRRIPEATIAVALGFGLGLFAPALYGVWGPPLRGTVVALVATALILLLSWTPARRVRIPAIVGAVVALLALTIVAVERALTETPGTAWVLLLVGAAFVAAFGFVRGPEFAGPWRRSSATFFSAPVLSAPQRAESVQIPPAPPSPYGSFTTVDTSSTAAEPSPTPPPPSVPSHSGTPGDVVPELPARPAEVVFASLVPPLALGTAALAITPWVGEWAVVTVALLVSGGLHLAAAALHRVPLAAGTRWTAFAAAVVAAVAAILVGDVRAIEAVTFPVAAMLLGGASLAMWRRARSGEAWPGSERVPWLAGVVLAVAPSVATDPHDVRAWLVIVAALLAAIGCVVAPIADSRGLATPSAVVLSAGALAMGLRAMLEPSIPSGDYAAFVAGAGAIVVAASLVWMSETDAAPRASTWLAAAGAALLLGFVVVQSEGDAVQASLTATLSGAIGLAGAAMLRWRRWAELGAILAVAGSLATLMAVGGRFAAIAGADGAGIEPDLWATAGVGIVVAIGIMALRSTQSGAVARIVSATFSIALALFAGAEAVLLASADPDEVRTLLTVAALTIVGVVAFVFRDRLGLLLAVSAGVLTGVFALVALAVFGVRPVELATVAPALGLVFLGARALHRDPAARSWPTLGPGLALLTIPSLVYDFTDPSVVDDVGGTALWRVVGLGVVAIALVVVGAVRRLQAPLVLGSAVLIVHALAQLRPWISDLYVAVPWWLWLGVGGALLIVLAARYERRMRDLRAAFTAVSSLR